MSVMTVTRALAELKTLDSRISKHISDFEPFEVAVGERIKGSHSSMKIEDFNKEVKEEAQSIKDLIKRREVIKDAISKSNYETKVKLGGEELTIIQVLNRKQTTYLAYDLLKSHLERQVSLSQRAFDNATSERNNQIEKNVSMEISSTKESGKVSSDERANIVEKWEKMLPEIKYLDPVKAKEWLKEIEAYVNQFKHEVDYLLSESNSTTTIEVPD